MYIYIYMYIYICIYIYRERERDRCLYICINVSRCIYMILFQIDLYLSLSFDRMGGIISPHTCYIYVCACVHMYRYIYIHLIFIYLYTYLYISLSIKIIWVISTALFARPHSRAHACYYGRVTSHIRARTHTSHNPASTFRGRRRGRSWRRSCGVRLLLMAE